MTKVKVDLESKLADATQQIQDDYEQRIRDLEGTAADLKTIPILGPIVIFLRGTQRPVWGYGVMWMDYNVYSGIWHLPAGSREEACFYIINLLVLGFLFGERAIQNLMPLFERLLEARKPA